MGSRFALSALIVMVGAASAVADELCVTIKEVVPHGGTLMVALYNNAQSYKAERYVMGQEVAPNSSEVNTCFAGLLSGNYAVAAFQDTNGSGKLEKNFLGAPMKPYGFSRDAKAMFGPPDFEDIAVALGSGRAETVLTLKR